MKTLILALLLSSSKAVKSQLEALSLLELDNAFDQAFRISSNGPGRSQLIQLASFSESYSSSPSEYSDVEESDSESDRMHEY